VLLYPNSLGVRPGTVSFSSVPVSICLYYLVQVFNC
jgi:hypothetical protein